MGRAVVAELLGSVACAGLALGVALHTGEPEHPELALPAAALEHAPPRANRIAYEPSPPLLLEIPAAKLACRVVRRTAWPLPDLGAAAEALERSSLMGASVEVVVSEADPARIAIRVEHAIALSVDGGRHFSRILDGEAEPTSLAFDCAGHLATCVDDELWIYTGRGRWHHHRVGGRCTVVPGDGPSLAITTGNELRVTTDLGATWHHYALPDPHQAFRRRLAGTIELVGDAGAMIEAPWPAIHADGMISRLVEGRPQPWLAVEGPERDGEIVNTVAIDAAERIWIVDYHGGGSCDGSEELRVISREPR